MHTLRAGIVAKVLQILYVAVKRRCLTIACAITIVGQEPAKGHIVINVAVDGGTCRELIIVLLAIKALLHTAVILLALVVALAVLVEHEAVVGLLPVVAVVSIEVTFVKTKLGQQHRVTSELVKVVEQVNRLFVHHNKGVEVVLLMRQNNLTLLGGTKVVAARLKGVPHHTIATRAPIERCGRCHTAIYPVVGVFNGNALALVAEASVLHTATVKVLARLCLERQCGAVLVKRHRSHALHHRFATLGVDHGHQACLLVKAHGNARCRNYHTVALVAQVNALC